MGEIACGRIIHYRSKESGSKEHPKIAGFTNINATSASKKWGGLSPMKLGPFYMEESINPIDLYPSGIHPGFEKINDKIQRIRVTNMENIWQFSKIYPQDLDDDGNVLPSFFLRRAKGAADPKPHRRALPKKQGIPISSYWDGMIMDYIPSRYVYCTMYSTLVRLTPEWKELESLHLNGTNIHIIGYDGRDVPITKKSMDETILDPERPFGHELVLCCMLGGLEPWNNLIP